MNEKKKTLTNLTVGVVTQLIVIALGLIVPRIVLVNYGSDTNGLINTIGQIFTYMALLEAGISVSARKKIETIFRLWLRLQENITKEYRLCIC